MNYRNAATRRSYGMRERVSTRPMKRYVEMAECRKCGAEVLWTETKKGKKIQLNNNLGMHSRGCFDETGAYLPRGGRGRTAHVETCPAANPRQRTPSEDRGMAQRQRQWELVCQSAAKTWSLNELQAVQSQMSRLIGIMRSSGADPSSVEKTREIVKGIIRKGWSQ